MTTHRTIPGSAYSKSRFRSALFFSPFSGFLSKKRHTMAAMRLKISKMSKVI